MRTRKEVNAFMREPKELGKVSVVRHSVSGVEIGVTAEIISVCIDSYAVGCGVGVSFICCRPLWFIS